MVQIPSMKVPDFAEALFGPVHHLSVDMEPCPGCGDGSTHHFLSHGAEGRDGDVTHSLVFEHRTPAKPGFTFKITVYIEPVWGEDAWGRRSPTWNLHGDGWEVQPCPPWPLELEIVQWPPRDPAPRPEDAVDEFAWSAGRVKLCRWELRGWEPGGYGEPGSPGRWVKPQPEFFAPPQAPHLTAWLAFYRRWGNLGGEWHRTAAQAMEWLRVEQEMGELSPIGVIAAAGESGTWFRGEA